ncbi:hypothetical protein VTH06DRAFT_1240 [Thermothelomyces fergusii]
MRHTPPGGRDVDFGGLAERRCMSGRDWAGKGRSRKKKSNNLRSRCKEAPEGCLWGVGVERCTIIIHAMHGGAGSHAERDQLGVTYTDRQWPAGAMTVPL